MKSRVKSRIIAMQILFQGELNKWDLDFENSEDVEKAISFLEEEEKEIIEEEYVKRVIIGVKTNMETIDKKIEENMSNWSINRLPKVDISILRLVVYEIIFEEDIPTEVSINEGVELAKTYSGEKSSKFINGVLGALVR